MTTGFVGRKVELALLSRRLTRAAANGDGTALVIRGRRQVGKSRAFAQEFCNTADVPYLFYTATKGASPVEAISAFFAELAESSLPRDRALIPTGQVSSWPDAFRVLASVLPESPVVIVLDELPWLAEQDEMLRRLAADRVGSTPDPTTGPAFAARQRSAHDGAAGPGVLTARSSVEPTTFCSARSIRPRSATPLVSMRPIRSTPSCCQAGCLASSAPGRERFRRLSSPSANARTQRPRCSGSPRRRCWPSSPPRTPRAG